MIEWLLILVTAMAGIVSDDMPPKRFQQDGYATVFYLAPTSVDEVCRNGQGDFPWNILGCTDMQNRATVLPNPCLYGDREEYARLACHELGHANGWPRDHPE